MMHNYFCMHKCLDFCDDFLTRIVEYQNLMAGNPIFLEQVERLGIISGEEAMNWGLAGPTLRASRISWHLHTVTQYECHTQFLYWDVQRQKGDSVARLS